MNTRSAPFGSILDVDGIGVGHHQRTGRGWQTGTTVIVASSGATPGVDVRGGGPGTRETDALRPQNLVQEIHAVTLTGGSAYGLAAVDGVVRELEARRLGFPVADHVVPVVPAAVIFDLGRGGNVANRPDPEFGRRAARAALGARPSPRWGSVGAGTGARAGGLQGGVGTASTTIALDGHDVRVGALAVVNARGSPVDPVTGLPWATHGLRTKRPSAAQRKAVLAAMQTPPSAGLNTTIGVVATSAALDKAECSKVASVAHDGLARAIRPAHSMADGDTVFTLATGSVDLPGHADGRIVALDQILDSAAEVFARACTHAIIAATTIGASVAWHDLCPHTLDAC